jgi:hypothetical protein
VNRPRPFVPPVAGAEVLLHHPALPAPMHVVPALPPDPAGGWGRSGWTFRPGVAAFLLDALAGRLHADRRTDYRYENVYADGVEEPGVAVLIEPTGHETVMPRISADLPHCPPPPAVTDVLADELWSVADQQPTPVSGDRADTVLAVLTAPDGRQVEELYVEVSPNVEQLDPGLWISVAARWCAPARRGLLVVPAGLVAVYEQADAEPEPEVFADNEGWLAFCRHCDESLFDPSCQPGMYYPQPDCGPGDVFWCPDHPRRDRHRPHAATWRCVELFEAGTAH